MTKAKTIVVAIRTANCLVANDLGKTKSLGQKIQMFQIPMKHKIENCFQIRFFSDKKMKYVFDFTKKRK